MSGRKLGPVEEQSASQAQAEKKDKAITPEVTIHPAQLRALEAIIEAEFHEMPLVLKGAPGELAKQCNLVLEEWRGMRNEQAPLEHSKRVHPAAKENHDASARVKKAKSDWNARNNVDLARKLLDEDYRPLADLASGNRRLAVLAVIALNDPIRVGRADSLVYVITLLHKALRTEFEMTAKVLSEAIASSRRELITEMWPSVAVVQRQSAALEKGAKKGAAANKARSVKAHAELRQIAMRLFEGNPTWKVKQVVDHISNTFEPRQGRKYSGATIRRAIQGVREEWRKDYEARGKKSGLY